MRQKPAVQKIIPFILILVLGLCCEVQAQQSAVYKIMNKGRIGIAMSANHQEQAVWVPYWLTHNFVLAPMVSFSYFQKDKMDFSLGLSTRHYFRLDDLSAWFGFRVGTMMLIPAGEDDEKGELYTDLFAGAAMGVEYFFVRNFSLGMEVQGNFIQSDERSYRFNNPGGFGVQLTPLLMATFYF